MNAPPDSADVQAASTPPAEAKLADSEPVDTGSHPPLTEHQAQQAWRAALGSLNDMTADCASHADSVAISGPNRLVVRFRGMYNSSKSFCERPARKETLEKALSVAAGKAIGMATASSIQAILSQPSQTVATKRGSVRQLPFRNRVVLYFFC